MFFWYICDGYVEEYSGQQANWDNSFIVCAGAPEDALIKLIRYYRGMLASREVDCNGETVLAIS